MTRQGMTHEESGRLGGVTAAEKLSPEQRQERSRKAGLALVQKRGKAHMLRIRVAARDGKFTREEAGKLGGLTTAHKMTAEERSERARKGGEALLAKYGRGHMLRLRLKQRKDHPMTRQEAGRIAGLTAAHRSTPEERQERGRKGGQAVVEKYGPEHMMEIRQHNNAVSAEGESL